ncbi:GGDEF domain-containing protein [Maricaulis sp.]|uniref:GGDEF domain-containing protein n=1 Tax=Maricaulis sp. TaxID=1486257 RepID=UPI0026188739|nr:GGDEF domain-containing protein [Maricaulis sp.]
MRIGPLNTGGNVARTGKSDGARKTGSTSAAGDTAAPRDAASIMGVPEAELTPNVQRALLSLMGEVDQLRKETERLRGRVRELESLADHDALLPVLNRRAFLREVSKALALAERHNAPSALVYLDLNGFKTINDTHGHAAGDAALHHVAGLLTAHIRETDAVGRLGGDEFGVVLTLTGRDGAEAKAQELVEIIETTPFTHKDESLTVGAAWGCQPLTAGHKAEEAMAQADAAMYARKQAQKTATTRKQA